MAAIIHDRALELRLMRERAISGADRYDEVWEGDYVMAPTPNNEHQFIVARLTRVLDEVVTDHDRGVVLPGANVGDRVDQWEWNYRVPDVAVFLNDGKAVNHDTFWFGGPDLAVEIASPGDETREKLGFYGKVGTRELLIIDRSPWKLELFRLQDQSLSSVDAVSPEDGRPVEITTCSLKMQFGSDPRSERPRILVAELQGTRSWTI